MKRKKTFRLLFSFKIFFTAFANCTSNWYLKLMLSTLAHEHYLILCMFTSRLFASKKSDEKVIDRLNLFLLQITAETVSFLMR